MSHSQQMRRLRAAVSTATDSGRVSVLTADLDALLRFADGLQAAQDALDAAGAVDEPKFRGRRIAPPVSEENPTPWKSTRNN